MASNDLQKPAPLDDVDFTSGFESQYMQEYHPLNLKVIVPLTQDSKTLWYRDLQSIIMVAFILPIFLLGTALLIKLVLTSNPLYVIAITAIYVIVALIIIVIEVESIHVL